ncbi:MAG: triple tyrosine motif-containing protein [Bacteroidetes bacterium]|nr:triple tyrosine motif-containing protein [Bacteroidota bacterium]
MAFLYFFPENKVIRESLRVILLFSWIMIAAFAGAGNLNRISKSTSQPWFNHLTKENGLPSNTVYCAIQDFQGYIWIGTTNGLARYDGHDMKIFRSIPGDSTSLVDNIVYTLCQASDSMIWIGTGNGLSIYNPFTRSLRNFPFDRKRPGGFPTQRVNGFFELSKGSVWIGTMEGMVHATGNGSHFRQVKINDCIKPEDREYSFNIVTGIIPHPRNHRAFLVGTGMGLVLFDTVTSRIIRKYDGPPGVELIIREMFLDSSRLIWACGWGVGVGCFDLEKEQWKIHSPEKWGITILKMMPRSRDELWLATDDRGLGVFNKKTGAFSFIKSDPKNPWSISSDMIQGMSYFNNRRDFWIWGNGIDMENKDFCSFQQVRVPYKFWWICDFYKEPATGKLFVGAYECKGMPVLDTKTQSWSLVPCDQPLSRHALSVTGFCNDSQGRLWVATRNNLCYYEPKRKILKLFRTLDGKPLQLTDQVVYGLNEDREGNLWVGTRFDGVVRINKTRDKADYFRHIPGDDHSLLAGTHYAGIQTDRFNRVWLGCRYGVSIYDPETKMFDNTLMDTLAKYGIRKTWINGVEKDSLGRIWLSVAGAGLVRIEIRAGRSYGIRLFYSGNGINDPETGWIAKDDGGNFWVTNSGLLQVDPYRERFTIIDNQNGLHQVPGSSGKIYVDHDGIVYVGDSTGFEMKNVSDIRTPEKVILNVVFESLEINGKVAPETLYRKSPGRMTLQAGQNNLTFHYTAICFHHTGEIHYRYKLLGYDREWIYTETSREARYTNLPPGKYTFVVGATRGDGWQVCSEKIQFVIKPFFWQTWWFILLCILALFALFVFIYRYRVNQLLKVERLRTRIATDLHDDVSSTLSSISILSDIVGRRPDHPKSPGMIGEIGSSAREMLERIDDIIWTVTPANDKFQDLELRIREYAIPLFESKNILFHFDFPEKLAALRLQMETRRNVYLVTKEAVNNLIKYAQCEHARVCFSEEQGYLVMEISDDGIGFDPGKPTGRNGLKNMLKRANQIGGSLDIRSRPGAGTQIILKVKLI